MDPENLCNGCLEPSGGGEGKGRGGRKLLASFEVIAPAETDFEAGAEA